MKGGDIVLALLPQRFCRAECSRLASERGLHYFPAMSIQELESEVTRLSKPDLAAFSQWLEEFVANSWDKQIETDIANGMLDQLARQADENFEAGRCTPL
jgi:hypothetical protein